MMLFKKKYLDAIRSGRKTQTIRVWRHRHVRAGQISYTPGVGRIRITAIEEIRLEDLSNDDAIRDGFASAVDLVTEIRQMYAERLEKGYRIFKIGFEVAEQPTE